MKTKHKYLRNYLLPQRETHSNGKWQHYFCQPHSVLCLHLDYNVYLLWNNSLWNTSTWNYFPIFKFIEHHNRWPWFFHKRIVDFPYPSVPRLLIIQVNRNLQSALKMSGSGCRCLHEHTEIIIAGNFSCKPKRLLCNPWQMSSINPLYGQSHKSLWEQKAYIKCIAL